MASLKLLEKTTIGGNLVLKNRMVLCPLTRGRCGRSQVPNDTNAEYYVQRSTAGLVISEGVIPCPEAMGWAGAPGIWNDEQIAGWKDVVAKVHAADGVFFMQIWHMGRVASSCFTGIQPIGPSPQAAEGHAHDYDGTKVPYEVPREIPTEEIPNIVELYRQTAKNAKAAGFDGIEIHNANGYLLDQFFQSCSNQRTDAYGGSPENRFRLSLEILEAVKESFPISRIGMRFSPNGNYNSMGSPDIRESMDYALSKLPTDMAYVHIIDGLAFGFHEKCPQYTLEDARKVYKGTIIGNCGYTKDTAEAAILSGNADLMSFGRPYMANPDLPQRFANDWPLAEAGMETWWRYPNFPEGDPSVGYSDWPVYKA